MAGDLNPPRGWVYVMESAGLYKIGWSSTPKRRLGCIKTGSAVPVSLIGVVEGSVENEHEWHWCFREKRVHGEWFRLTEEDVEHILHESFGIDRLPEYHADSYIPARDDYEAC